MSRLDSAIRRLKSQKLCLEFAFSKLEEIPGVIFEIGLGNGRTYDHLRELFYERKIYVFEKNVKAKLEIGGRLLLIFGELLSLNILGLEV